MAGVRLNDQAITDEEAGLSQSDFVDGKAKISAGKKRHALIVLLICWPLILSIIGFMAIHRGRRGLINSSDIRRYIEQSVTLFVKPVWTD